MEVYEYEEQATQVQEEEHDYLQIIDRHRGEISPISSRLYYHLDTISNKITSTKLKFVFCFILGCITAVSIVTHITILFHRPAAVTCHQYENCSSFWPCYNHGQCMLFQNEFTCLCQKGYLGSHCEIKDQCILSIPCYHAGTCITTHNASYCICTEGFLGQNCEYRGPKGHQFFIVFNPRYRNIILYMASNQHGKCDIILPSSKTYKTLSLRGGDYISYSLSNLTERIIQQIKVDLHVRVECDVRITLYYFLMGENNTIWKTFQSYPSAVLSTKYILPHYKVHKKFDALGIIALENDTSVRVHFKSAKWVLSDIVYRGKYYSKDIRILTVTANQYEYSYVSCDKCHLTGTYLVSSRPFALFFKSYIPEAIPVLPLKDLSRVFIVPRLSDDISVLGLRIFTIKKTKIEFKETNDSVSTSTLNSNDYLNTNHKDTTIISSVENVNLFLKTYGPNTGTTDHGVPGVAQYLPYYEFIIPHHTSKNFATIIIATRDITGLRLDKRTVKADAFVGLETFSISEKLYSILSIRVDVGWHTAVHSQHVPFGLLVQGISKYPGASQSSSYVYFAGMNYSMVV